MKKEYLEFLFCPSCHSDLIIVDEVYNQDRIESGILFCNNCKENNPISNFWYSVDS